MLILTFTVAVRNTSSTNHLPAPSFPSFHVEETARIRKVILLLPTSIFNHSPSHISVHSGVCFVNKKVAFAMLAYPVTWNCAIQMSHLKPTSHTCYPSRTTHLQLSPQMNWNARPLKESASHYFCPCGLAEQCAAQAPALVKYIFIHMV